MTQESRGDDVEQGPVTGPAGAGTTTEIPASGSTQPAPQQQVPGAAAAPWSPHPFPQMAQMPPDHPQAVTILVLGIVGIMGVWVTSPIAWYLGNQALREIDASPGRYGHRDFVSIGRILGIVGTVLLGVGVAVVAIFVLFYAGLFAAMVAGS
ncbi:DUF4190 domain-containing protein [Janibacter melonis]|uniref:DUF4190 domain-containing protein n=1 Tax=Janibacter melonis TaxID=262209 RepID=UPI001786FDBC